jgi:hypothetical protein
MLQFGVIMFETKYLNSHFFTGNCYLATLITSGMWTKVLLLVELSYITTDGQSASLSWYQAPIWGL